MSMFGGKKFSKGSEILRNASNDVYHDGTSDVFGNDESANSVQFQKINEAENHAKLIMKDGQSKYIADIKKNVMELVHQWLGDENSRIFTLYGKMGCGKSFFASRVYQDVCQKEHLYHTVAFSSQQIYRDTTIVRNMLLSIAHQLFTGIPGCRKYFASRLLDSESISRLTENVFFDAFEGVTLQKPLVIVIDGLDEYPQEDCEQFLETLGRLRSRLNPRLKIFFTSRPEAYIMSQIACDSDHSSYHIEKNAEHSHADCACFVDVKCEKAGIRINDDMKRKLIEKSECSLKYLECFFNEISTGSVQVTPHFIENLPHGLSQYYRDQLVRYFGDTNLTYYKNKIVPLLELLCVVLRPITVQEAGDILGYREAEINRIISRSGTLLWKNTRYIMLYQSESIRDFLVDDRYCPEKFRIDRENGTECILKRMRELMDASEDIENNMYLFTYGVEHILDQERISAEDWRLLLRVVNNYSHKQDVMGRLTRLLLEKPIREIVSFMRLLYAENSPVSELLRDAFCVRLVAVTVNEKRVEKLFSVFDSLESDDRYEFLIHYGRCRCLRSTDKPQEALNFIKTYLDISNDADLRTRFQYTYYLDEACRIYRSEQSISWAENTHLHVRIIKDTKQLCNEFRPNDLTLYLVTLRCLSVSYDQLARLCEQLSKESDPQLRMNCAQMLQTVLKLQESDPLQPGFFLLASAACFKEGLSLSKYCQQFDSFSDARIYDLYFSFYALGNLYANKDFPAFNPEMAKAYYEDCLTSILDIAKRPESPEKYIRVPIKTYDKLVKLHISIEKFEDAWGYLEEGQRMRELYLLYHPGSDSEFESCYGAELQADLVLAQHGIEVAERDYLVAVNRYKACGEKYSDEFTQRAPGIVYYHMTKEFKKSGNVAKYVEYRRLELVETQRMYSMFHSDFWYWDLGISHEMLSYALRELDDKGTLTERIPLMEKSIAIYEELNAAHPDVSKYQIACVGPFHFIFWDYYHDGKLDQARDIMMRTFALMDRIAEDHPRCHSMLDVPVRQFLVLQKRISALANDVQMFEKCKAYLEKMALLTDEHDFVMIQCEFMAYEAQRVLKDGNVREAERLYEDAAQATRAFAQRFGSKDDWRVVEGFYVELYMAFRKVNKCHEARLFIQETLKKLDGEIESITGDALELRNLRCLLYGLLADDFGNESDAELIATAADLYFLQINEYVSMYKATENEEYFDHAQKAFENMQKFLRIQEVYVKFALKIGSTPTESLRIYVRTIISIYSNFYSEKDEDAQKKLAYYTQLLEKLDNQ